MEDVPPLAAEPRTAEAPPSVVIEDEEELEPPHVEVRGVPRAVVLIEMTMVVARTIMLGGPEGSDRGLPEGAPGFPGPASGIGSSVVLLGGDEPSLELPGVPSDFGPLLRNEVEVWNEQRWIGGQVEAALGHITRLYA